MDIFQLLGTIAINNSQANKNIDNTMTKAQGLQTRMGQAFTRIGQDAIKCGKVVAKGLAVVSAAGAAAAGYLFKESISQYAEYEQLVGGVETLFKDSSDKVMGYAKNAYKTAGLSANDYMSTVTSFSASLLQGLGGDTAVAAEIGNMAVTDMADNANKMGTAIGSIQDAYQGFAKDNYTMLDNLKLGYGGTAGEMARLVNDSGVLGDKFVATAENINEVSFADIIRAIHKIQEEMGITGTTAKEASETISGSFNTWKASWTNLMTGIAGDENIDLLVDAFFDAGETMLHNIGRVLPKIGQNIQKVLGVAGAKVKAVFVQTIWPGIQEFAKVNFGITLPEWSTIESTVSTWWGKLKTGFDQVCKWTLGLFEQPNATVTEVGEAIVGWWNDTALPGLKSASAWALQLFGMPVEDQATITGHAAAWFKTVSGWVAGACSWTLQLFGMPKESADEIASKLKTWWSGVADTVETALDWTLKCMGVREWTDDDTKAVRIWWDGVYEQIKSAIEWLLGPPSLPEISEMVQSINTWWNNVKNKLHLTFGITPEVQAGIQNYQDQKNEVGASAGAQVTEKTGSSLAGAVVEQYVNNAAINPDSNVNFGAILDFFNVKPDGSHASGLSYVPRDNYLANLHLGEAVLPRNEAEEWRGGVTSGKGVSELKAEMQALRSQMTSLLQTIATNTSGGHQVVLDTGILVGSITPRIDMQMGQLTARKERRG